MQSGVVLSVCVNQMRCEKLKELMEAVKEEPRQNRAVKCRQEAGGAGWCATRRRQCRW